MSTLSQYSAPLVSESLLQLRLNSFSEAIALKLQASAGETENAHPLPDYVNQTV